MSRQGSQARGEKNPQLGFIVQVLIAGGIRYFKHGYGCAVSLPAGKVDFDFGEQGVFTCRGNRLLSRGARIAATVLMIGAENGCLNFATAGEKGSRI